MLTALRLGNFKAFAETQTIPLRPLTLIFGANSSGKSSIIHGLLFAHEANRANNLDVRRTEIGGDSVDLGGFRQFLFGHDVTRDLEWTAELDASESSDPRLQVLGSQKLSVAMSVGFRQSPGLFAGMSKLAITSYRVSVDGSTVLQASFDPDLDFHLHKTVKIKIRELNLEHPLLRHATAADLNEVREPGADALAWPVPCKTGSPQLDERLSPMIVRAGDFPPFYVSMDFGSVATPQGPKKNKRSAQTDLRQYLPAINDCSASVAAALSLELGKLVYLGPIRSYPPRDLAFDKDRDPNWVSSGGQAYELAARESGLRQKINDWLGKLSTPYELVVEHLWTERGIREYVLPGSIADAIPVEIAVRLKEGLEEAVTSGSLSHEDIISEAFELADELSQEAIRNHLRHLPDYRDEHLIEGAWWRGRMVSLRDKRTDTLVSHRDVGIGVSQVLPVLVNAFALQNRIVAIEQPEIHLHPALQADVADVFIESALGERKNRFILETHSEHLILRVMRRMRDTVRGQRGDAPPVRPEDVAVLFVEPTSKGSVVHELRLKADGSLLDPWPGGFFEESFSEMFG